ncbi:MAG: FAD-dependent oxidoreductase [Bacteroidales bacterium]|nr:FAD-dependent oxidoreductase [Bacteroidales bacterium]
MLNTDITIIGAGITGTAAGGRISEYFSNVFIIGKHPVFGQETSSRNNEVIHAAIYYPGESLRTVLWVKRKKLLYDYCELYS